MGEGVGEEGGDLEAVGGEGVEGGGAEGADAAGPALQAQRPRVELEDVVQGRCEVLAAEAAVEAHLCKRKP